MINLRSRADRRRWICRSCLPALRDTGADVALLQAVEGQPLPAAAWWRLSEAELRCTAQRWRRMFPQELLGLEELRRFYQREVSSGWEKG